MKGQYAPGTDLLRRHWKGMETLLYGSSSTRWSTSIRHSSERSPPPPPLPEASVDTFPSAIIQHQHLIVSPIIRAIFYLQVRWSAFLWLIVICARNAQSNTVFAGRLGIVLVLSCTANLASSTRIATWGKLESTDDNWRAGDGCKRETHSGTDALCWNKTFCQYCRLQLEEVFMK